MLNIGLKMGPYKLNLKKLKSHPHGIDLGALSPMMPKGLFTPDKKINLAPEPLAREISAIKLHLENYKTSTSLKLISRRNLRSNNSWMHGIDRLQGGSNKCTLQINPQDAKGITDGSRVQLRSEIGAIDVIVELNSDMMPGVVSLPFGWPEGSNYNILVDETKGDIITGNAGFSGIEVKINKTSE
jgi:anaerobic selenocysteine-containing dehydrogenase